MEPFLPISSKSLVDRYRVIHTERMQGLPIVNNALDVEGVGFCPFEEHQIGVLITPWFINLVLLPGTDIGSKLEQGSKSTLKFPSGPIEFTTARDEVLGTYLTAVLFRSAAEFPNQETARDIAAEVLRELFNEANDGRRMSRRALFANVGAFDA